MHKRVVYLTNTHWYSEVRYYSVVSYYTYMLFSCQIFNEKNNNYYRL